MTSPLRSIRKIPDDVTDVPALRVQLNRLLTDLQVGALLLGGIRLDIQRDTVPVDAPLLGQPNLVAVLVGGVVKLYLYDVSTGWVVVGTQS